MPFFRILIIKWGLKHVCFRNLFFSVVNFSHFTRCVPFKNSLYEDVFNSYLVWPGMHSYFQYHENVRLKRSLLSCWFKRNRGMTLLFINACLRHIFTELLALNMRNIITMNYCGFENPHPAEKATDRGASLRVVGYCVVYVIRVQDFFLIHLVLSTRSIGSI
jgi:hypothetical protein